MDPTGCSSEYLIKTLKTLGLETSPNITLEYGLVLSFIDKVALTIFTIELIGKLIVYRLNFF